MNHILVQHIYWFAFICYAIPCIIYMYKLAYYIEIKDYLQLLNYSTLACAFLAFSVYTFMNALENAKNKIDTKTTEPIYKSPARLGYGIMVLNFLIIFISAYINNQSIYLRSIIGTIGYLCLTLKIDYGIFLILAYYLLSIIIVNRYTLIEFIYGLSKIGLLTYFTLYAYRYIKLHHA